VLLLEAAAKRARSAVGVVGRRVDANAFTTRGTASFAAAIAARLVVGGDARRGLAPRAPDGSVAFRAAPFAVVG
jgi:hypothetical protein